MQKRTVDYIKRKKSFIEIAHKPSVKSMLVAEFKSSKNILVKKDILKTLESIEELGKKQG
jgi:hypothetical protein